MNRFFCIGTAMWLLFMGAVGDVYAVTSGIPHAGHHGHAPSVLGYLALYGLLLFGNALLLGFTLAGPIADGLDY